MPQKKLMVVTGGAGFIGSHLCRRLRDAGHRVISLDNYFTGDKKNHISEVAYREGHTKDIERHIPEIPDVVFHLGEYSRVEISLSEPALVWDLNCAGTFGVLEFWRKKRSKLVYAGSSTKFGDGGLGRVQSPYAYTKASNTELVQNYGNWFGLPYAIAYFYNVYGPGERDASQYGTLIETFRQQRRSGRPFTVVAPGTQRRHFTHVLDIIEGLVLIADKGEGDEFGLGSPESYSVLEVAKLFGGDIIMLPERKGNRMDASLDTSKSRSLGWAPTRTLETYIHEDAMI